MSVPIRSIRFSILSLYALGAKACARRGYIKTEQQSCLVTGVSKSNFTL